MNRAYKLSRPRRWPHHIRPHVAGFVVEIHRGGVVTRAFVNKNKPNALAEAVKLRDKLLIAAGELRYPLASQARSNTGIAGITETTRFIQNRPICCFSVCLGRKHRPQFKQVYFGAFRTRAAALKTAIELRRSIGAVLADGHQEEANV